MKFKTLLLSIVTIVVSIAALSRGALAADEAGMTGKVDRGAVGPVWVVGVDTSFMPFEFKQGDTYVGFDIDLWDAIAAHNDWRYRIKPMDFNGLIPGLQTRQLDVALAGIGIKAERKKVIAFSAPYYDSGLAALVRSGDSRFKAIQDLDGKRIAAKTGTATIDWLKTGLPGATIVQFPNIDQAYMALEAGRVDAAMHDTPNVQYFANTAGKGKVQLAGEAVRGDQYGIAFPKNSPLVGKTNEALDALKTNGTYAAIYRKWFGVEPPEQARQVTE